MGENSHSIRATMSANQRQFSRLPIQGPVHVWTKGEAWDGNVVNQSIGGIGIKLPGHPKLVIGDEVQVRYNGADGYGFVRFLKKHESDITVGVAWDQREEDRSERRDEAAFFVGGRVEVVCSECVPDEENNITFRLWDGTEFTDDATQIATRSVADRTEYLSADLDSLDTLTRLYKLGAINSPEEAIRRVVDFEFTV